MISWTFSHNDGVHTTVDAYSEQDGRAKAMLSRWGKPTPQEIADRLYSLPYRGEGLLLVSTKEGNM